MIRRLSLVLALLVWTPAHAALDVDFGRYHALVIGINDYQNLPRLETAVNDASAVADVLRQKYGFKVELLLNPTRDKVIRTLDRLRRELTERDNLLIYYAGHGVLDVEADAGFWMSVDAEEETQSDWISIATVTSTVRAMSAKHVMIVSDSCYSGRLTRGLSVSVKTGAERVEELRRLAGKRSRTALVSGGLEPVNDGGGEGHSVFTRAFLAALRESTEVLDGQQLFTAVRRPVIVNADQTPEYSDIRLAGHDGGDFLFVPVSLAVPSTALDEQASSPEAAPRARESNLEVVFWESIRESKNSDNFEAYLAQFTSGIFAALARNKLEEIKATESAAVAVATTDPITAGVFDGEWTGRTVLKSGHGMVCKNARWSVTISGNGIVGKAWRDTALEGTIDEAGRLEGKTYYSSAVYGGGSVAFEGAFGDGAIIGTATSEGGALGCRWAFTLTKEEPS